jgi:hypothetical protein
LNRDAVRTLTPAERRYERASVQLRIARAQMLLGLAGKVDPAQLPGLLTFAGQIGDTAAADSLVAFRSAQSDQLQAAQAELDRLNT